MSEGKDRLTERAMLSGAGPAARLHRIRCLVTKELAQIRRDRRIVALLVAVPVIQLLVIGFAATTDIKEVRLAVRDLDHSWHSDEYVRALGSSGYFRIEPLSGPQTGDGRWLVSGRAGLVLVVPRGFGEGLKNGRTVKAQVLVDGSDSNFGVQGLGYLMKATRLFSAGLMEGYLKSADPESGSRPSVAVQSRVWYNPGLVSRVYMVPAVMALLMMVVTMIATSMSLVKELEDGTMEQVIVTPLRPFELIAGKLWPFVMIGLVELTLALLAIRFAFQIPCRGSLFVLYVMAGLFLLTTLGLGLLVSTLARNQQQAMLIAAFFIMMPFILLSGFAFPVENMPPVMQVVTHFIPLKYFVQVLRALFLKGVGWAELWHHAAILAGFGVLILGAAVLRFRKRLD